jgi:predicted NACHT family NTPase
MAGQTGRSLRLSAQKIEKANTALLKFGSKADLAAQLQMSRTTINKFFKGEPVEQKKFRAICKKLKLILEEVANLPKKFESEPFEQNQDNNGDLDELVQEVRSRCCDKIQDQYSKIQLLNRQQIDVDKLYVDVYVLEKPVSESYATIPDLVKGSDLGDGFDRLGLGKREKRAPGFEVAAHYPRLMILGKPGSGKSTFLRHLAVACCKGEFQADQIPILVELRDIKDASHFNLLNKIHKEFGLANQSQTEQILNQGKVLILLDGLDELLGQSRRDLQEHIYEFSQQYYKNRFILTCRTQTTEYTLSTFDYVEVAPFKPEQVEIFARNWFAALAETPEQGEELTAQFLKKLRLPENKQTAELAVTPILLTLTCWVFNDLKDLPPKRSDLYEQAIKLLLEKWDEKRGVKRELGSEAYRKLSVGEKKKLLSYLAARKFEQEQYVLFEQGEIQGYIAEYLGISIEDSEAVLDAVAAQHGLVIEQAQQIWSFSHLTFQEYFTAKWFCDRADWEGLVSHLTEKQWREVFLLVVGMLPNTEHLLLLMKQRVDAIIAADEKLQQFLTWASQKSQLFQWYYKPAAVRALYLLFFQLETTFDTATIPIIELTLSHTLDPRIELTRKAHVNTAPNGSSTSTVTAQVSFEFSYNLSRNLAIDLCLSLAIAYALVLAFDLKFANFVPDITYFLTFKFDINAELKQLLQQLQKQLPNRDEERFTVWWKTKGQAWAKQLRSVMIEHRNIGHDWRLSNEQKKFLQWYYDANETLVYCLNSGCMVSDEVRKEIEETLLLPVDDIKKCQQRMQVADIADE